MWCWSMLVNVGQCWSMLVNVSQRVFRMSYLCIVGENLRWAGQARCPTLNFSLFTSKLCQYWLKYRRIRTRTQSRLVSRKSRWIPNNSQIQPQNYSKPHRIYQNWLILQHCLSKMVLVETRAVTRNTPRNIWRRYCQLWSVRLSPWEQWHRKHVCCSDKWRCETNQEIAEMSGSL